MTDKEKEVVWEATHAYNDNLGAGCYVGDLLGIINRQKAEIEELEREIEDLESIQEISPEAKYLVDTKADKVISLLTEINKSQEQIKAEAVKEFANKIRIRLNSNTPRGAYLLNIFDNVVKEMVGDADG